MNYASISDGLSSTLSLGHSASVCRGPSGVWYTITGMINGTSIPIHWTLGIREANEKFAYENKWTGRRFSSFHPGGTPLGMADGSVSYVIEAIDQRTYDALGSRSGSETAPAGGHLPMASIVLDSSRHGPAGRSRRWTRWKGPASWDSLPSQWTRFHP